MKNERAKQILKRLVILSGVALAIGLIAAVPIYNGILQSNLNGGSFNINTLADVYLNDDGEVGIDSGGRIVFDDQATDEINIIAARLGVGSSDPDHNIELKSDSADFYIRQIDDAYSSGLLSDTLGQGMLGLWNDNPDTDAADAEVWLDTDGDSWVNASLAGNFGIGTITPATALDVGGTVTATEFVGGGVGLTGIIADSVYQAVRNNSGAGVSLGDAVYITGWLSDKPTIALADNDGAGTYPAAGIVSGTIANNDTGFIITSGLLGGLNTTAFSENDALYLDSTAGAWTDTRPSARGEIVQAIARVTRSNGAVGTVMVMGAARSNDESNDMDPLRISQDGAVNDQALVWDGSTSQYSPESIITETGAVLTVASGMRIAGHEVIVGTGTPALAASEGGLYADVLEIGSVSYFDGIMQLNTNAQFVYQGARLQWSDDAIIKMDSTASGNFDFTLLNGVNTAVLTVDEVGDATLIGDLQAVDAYATGKVGIGITPGTYRLSVNDPNTDNACWIRVRSNQDTAELFMGADTSNQSEVYAGSGDSLWIGANADSAYMKFLSAGTISLLKEFDTGGNALSSDGSVTLQIDNNRDSADSFIFQDDYGTVLMSLTQRSTSSAFADLTVSGFVTESSRHPVFTEAHAASHTLTAAECYGGATYYVTAAADLELPAVEDGMKILIYVIGNILVNVAPNGSDLIMLDGVALLDGYQATNLSTAGDVLELTYYSADGWYGASNGWIDGGAP